MQLTQLLQLSILAVLSLTPSTLAKQTCKAIPNTSSWPTPSEWASLNTTLHGRLLHPSPPGAVCHPDRPEYNAFTCPSVQAGWLYTGWHANDPLSISENGWNNDTCLPVATAPCSGLGYPIYVVNATCAMDVKRGVEFARKNKVRLVVKATGHDYLGRSNAPNSLSIWTHHMRGIEFHNGFKPEGCALTIPGAAITAAAGTQMLELNEAAHAKNLMIVSGGAGTVGLGGFLSGGGHSIFSSTFGLAADQVLEMEIVTPTGEIMTINECRNTDLFWAMRGGGGSTFGVMTSVTIKAYPAVPIYNILVIVGTYAGSPVYWDVIASILASMPSLDALGISAYSEFFPNISVPELGFPGPVDGYRGNFFLLGNSAANSTDSLIAAVTAMLGAAVAPYEGQFFVQLNPVNTFADFWAYFEPLNGPLDAGHDQVLGGRLVGADVLLGNRTALREAYRLATPPGSITSAYLVGGRGVINAKPRGGSNAVNSAWRKAYLHNIIVGSWTPLDPVSKAKKIAFIDGVVEPLRKLTPGGGAYINEGFPYEKDWQHVFWGTNYARLLAIKKKVDPDDVLWCHPCVGNDGWQVVDNVLCKI